MFYVAISFILELPAFVVLSSEFSSPAWDQIENAESIHTWSSIETRQTERLKTEERNERNSVCCLLRG